MHTQNDTHVMLSEEEEEEDEEDELEAPDSEKKKAGDYVGEHLKAETSVQKQQPRTQVFSGSSDEWTDQRIREFQEQMEKSRLGISKPESETANKDSNAVTRNNANNNNMIHYETFESSSGDEMSRCIFESQALSFQNKDKVVNSKEKE